MKITDWVILAIILILVILAFLRMRRRKKSGKCIGCGGDCSACIYHNSCTRRESGSEPKS